MVDIEVRYDELDAEGWPNPMRDRPVLEYTRDGWILHYRDREGSAETYQAGDRAMDVDSALQSAQRWLALDGMA